MSASINSTLAQYSRLDAGKNFLRHFRFSIVFLLGALAVFSLSAAAQGPVNGGFAGTVTNSAGNPVADATVQFINQANGFRTAKKSDATGKFYQDNLPPGIYKIVVLSPGYRQYEKIQELYATRSNTIIPVPVVLESETATATPTPTPTVTQTTAPDVTVATSDVDESVDLNPRRGGAFNESAVQTVPLGGTTLTRTFDELAFYVPGVMPPPQAIGNSVGPGVGSGVGTSGQFSVNGLRSRANNFMVDGSDNNDEDIGVRRQGFFTLVPQPIESIQEFQIITLLAPAQFGRNLGAQVNALSKSGGNRFHGTIYGLGNASFLNARNFFDNDGGDTTNALLGRTTGGLLIPVVLSEGGNLPQPLNVTNDAGEKDTFSLLQGGFAIGGPIRREKLFFFASGEGQFMDGVRERHFAVPTVEQRGLLGSGAEGLFGIGPDDTAFPLFPTNLNGDTVFSLFPFPNDPNGIYGRNTYTKALSIDARGVILSGRIDYNLFQNTERPQVFTARYNYTDDQRDLTDVGGAIFSAIRPLVRTDNFSTFLTGGLTDNLSNEFRFSWGRTRLRFEELRDDFLRPITSLNSSEDTRFLLNAPLILNATTPLCPLGGPVPCPRTNLILAEEVTYLRSQINTEDFSLGPVGQVIIAGFSPIGVDVFNFPQERENDTFQFADTLRTQFDAKGQHSLAFGAEIRRVYLESNLPRNSRPLVTFYGGNCFNPTTLCPITNGFAQPLDFAATGAATGFSQSLVAPGRDAAINLSYNQLNFFVQDEWRAARNLILNFGLRYELNTTPKEADEKIEQTFNQTLPAYLSGLSQFINGRTNIYDSDRDNFAPRLGFAYSPNLNTVIRGGFGMYYDQILGAVVSQSRNVFPTFTTANFGGGTFSNDAGIFTLFNPSNAIFDLSTPQRPLICNAANVVLGLPFGNCGPNSRLLVQPGTLNTINPNLSSQELNAILGFLNSIFPSGSLFETTLPTRTLETPLSYQYSLGVEQRLMDNTFLSVAYVGTTGRKLLRFTTPNLGGNAVSRIDGFFYDDFNCNFDPTNPIFCRPLAAQGTAGVTPGFAPRRFPNAGVVNQFETTGRSQYHSLQIELRGRLARSFQYRTNYVLGQVKDDVSDVFDLAGAFALPQNSETFEGEYAPANFDVRHRFTYNFIYDTPGLENQNGFVRFVLGGWQIAGTGRFNTGQPFTVNTIYDRNQDGNLTDRLDNLQFITVTGDRRQPLTRSCDPGLGNCSAALAAFMQDGSIPRNSFRAGNVLELDMSFAKRFVFQEEQSVQLRVDVFNFINRANFGVPIRILEFPEFGRATETITPGRRIQIGLKYIF